MGHATVLPAARHGHHPAMASGAPTDWRLLFAGCTAGLALVLMIALPATSAVPAGGALALAFFIPVLCGSSVWLKHRRSVNRHGAAERTDHLAGTHYFQLYARNPMPNLIGQCWLPILVILLINLYFTRILVYTPPFDVAQFGNFLLLGHLFPAGLGADTLDYLRQSMNVMCYAYLGWYVWTVSTIFSRLVTLELVAATFYNVLMRLVVATFLALVFLHFQKIVPLTAGAASPEMIGFGIGLFPDTALAAIAAWLRRRLLGQDNRLEAFPLDLIQGISPFRKLRLYEMGLDDCANLASANAVELYLASSLKLVEVIDWIGQAQLLVLVGEARFLKLQQNGYRTIIDFHRGCGKLEVRPLLKTLLQFEDAQLIDVASGLAEDASYANLAELRQHLLDPLSAPVRPRPPKPVLLGALGLPEGRSGVDA
jgi:hypothetical protein